MPFCCRSLAPRFAFVLCTLSLPAWAEDKPSQEGNEGRIVKAAKLPKIDGKVDALWEQAPPHPIDNRIDGAITNSADLSGEWRAIWTPTHLALLVQVRDDAKVNDSPGHTYQDDQIEIFVTSDNKKPESYFKPKNTNTFAYENPRGGPSIETHKRTKGWQSGYGEVPGGWTFEIAIPYTDWNIAPRPGDLIGLEVQINDDDDGDKRDGKLSWSSLRDNAAFEPRLQGSARFVDAPAKASAAPAARP